MDGASVSVIPVSPRKSPRQQRSRRTVARILDAAAHIFHEQGYAGATTNDIADEAGVSIGSLYQYFPNKDALLLALAHQHIESAAAGLTDLLGQRGDENDFAAIVTEVVQFLVDQHDLDELHVLVMHEAPRTHELSVELDKAKAQLVDVTSALLRVAVADRQRRLLVARMVVATIDAGVHDVIIRQPRGALRRAAVELTISTALSIIEAEMARPLRTT
jgi:AcrR family transcriptional regulator